MKYLDLTFADPARNLACDELLLDLCERADVGEILRVWEPAGYFVVLGYSNKITVEVNIGACATENIPILRRFSGGGAVLQGPGCLNYALVLRNTPPGAFGDIAAAFRKILEPHRRLLSRMLSAPVRLEGVSDLTVAGKKFSGNSQYRRPGHTLFHGSFLLQFDFEIIERTLPMPSRQPAYRRARPHSEFLTNLPVDGNRLRNALRQEWGAGEEFEYRCGDKLEELVQRRYADERWTAKF